MQISNLFHIPRDKQRSGPASRGCKLESRPLVRRPHLRNQHRGHKTQTKAAGAHGESEFAFECWIKQCLGWRINLGESLSINRIWVLHLHETCLEITVKLQPKFQAYRSKESSQRLVCWWSLRYCVSSSKRILITSNLDISLCAAKTNVIELIAIYPLKRKSQRHVLKKERTQRSSIFVDTCIYHRCIRPMQCRIT